MSIVSISMVKNEADIIETFVRYHVTIFDSMVILDNGSTDNTKEIIVKLQKEGLPIKIIFDNNPSFDQSEITTNLLYSTINQFNPKWVVPLDVDEFIVSEKNNVNNLKDYFKSHLAQEAIYYLSWRTYVPTEQDNINEGNILKRIRHHREEENNHDYKIVISASIAKNNKIIIKQGNHDIESSNNNIIKIKTERLRLAHFPIRTINQAKSKYLVGWLANLARKEQVLFDWYYFYNIIKSKKIGIKDLTQMGLYYNVIDKNMPINLVDNPVFNSNELKIKFPKLAKVDYIKNLLNYTEILAREYSKVVNNKTSVNNEDQMVLKIIKDYLTIDGWLSTREAIGLYKLASSLKGKKDIVICEIGSWQGKSSFILAKAIEDKKDSILYCIDPFNSDGDVSSKKIYLEESKKLSSDLLAKFKQNMEERNLLHKIKIIKGYSNIVYKSFNSKIDLLFIDGNHDYEAVKEDFEKWSPLIKKGGFIAFHDVGAAHTVGPKRLIEESIVKSPLWTNHNLVDELFYAQRRK